MGRHCRYESTLIDFDRCVDFLTRAGRAYMSPSFALDESDYGVVFRLLVYFCRDAANAKLLDVDLRKGLLLSGPVGCGKTSLMVLMRFMLSKEDQYVVKSARDVSFEFVEDGYSVIHRYSKASFASVAGTLRPKTYCFDDLGVESTIRHYGNNTNVLAEVLMSRYDLYMSQGMLTHGTTNLSAAELEGCYGVRVRSRLRQMVNVVAFDGGSRDKRR